MAYALPYIVLVLAGALSFLGVTALFVPNKARRPMGFYLFLGAGLQFLLVLPVAMVQGALVMGPRVPVGQSVSSAANPAAARHAPAEGAKEELGRIARQPAPLRMALSMAGAPIHMGGLSTRLVFELIDGPLRRPDRGYPSSALASGVTITILAAFQVLGLSWLFGKWMFETANLEDRRIIALGAAVLLNSLLNIAWPWWGN
jgi:hypothetical protein